MAGELREITVEQLIARLKVSPGRYGFLLGAGCSVGAGIPAATGVIEIVAERLGRDPLQWKPTYAQALDVLGPLAVQQDLLREVIRDKQPISLHMQLAALVEARLITAIFTTNFDRLIERALAHTDQEMVTVLTKDHARTITVSGGLRYDGRPSHVVKLHGDYLTPGVRNQPWQVAQLDDGFRELFAGWLAQNGLVVVGYGMGDPSVRRALEDAVTNDGLPFGLVWVAREEDVLPKWIADLHAMRFVPWIDVLYMSDGEQLFRTLHSALVPRSPARDIAVGLGGLHKEPPHNNVEPRYQREVPMVSSAAARTFGKTLRNGDNSLVWLHLSDLHMCKPRTGWDARRVLQRLVVDLQHMEKEHGLHPDLIFFTGDAAFGQIGTGLGESIAEQFQEARMFFEGVRNAFSTPVQRANIFLVPGNHDVDRSAIMPAMTAWLDGQQSLDAISGHIHANDRTWRSYMERLVAYQDFLRNSGYDHLLVDPGRLLFATTQEVKGVRIGIAGLNSAWSCGRDGERGKLWVGGRWQIEHFAPEIEDADIKIALIHHPNGWFVEYEEPDFSREIEAEFQFHLHGHEHHGWVDQMVNGHVRVAAAACYDRSDGENGYNFMRLNLDTGQGEVWLRRYDREGRGWVQRVIYGKTDANGLWPLDHLLWRRSPDKAADFVAHRVQRRQRVVEPAKRSDRDLALDRTPLRVFCSYSHKDRKLLEQLKTFLAPLRERRLIELWYDAMIEPGLSWWDSIHAQLEAADIILLLVSPNYLVSEFGSNIELPRALERHKSGEARVIPVILRPCDWHGAPFSSLQALPANAKPVTTWSQRDKAWNSVVEGIAWSAEALSASHSGHE